MTAINLLKITLRLRRLNLEYTFSGGYAKNPSFRRTALTQMSAAGIPLRVIQELSGHRSLAALQKYLEVSEEQKGRAIAALTFYPEVELTAAEPSPTPLTVV